MSRPCLETKRWQVGEADHTTHGRLKQTFCALEKHLNVCVLGPPAAGKGAVAEKVASARARTHTYIVRIDDTSIHNSKSYMAVEVAWRAHTGLCAL